MTHVAIVKQNDNSGWLILHRQGDQWQLADKAGLRLEPVIESILAGLRKGEHRGDLTFTDRRMEEIATVPIPETPDDLQALIGASITVLAPEGKVGDATMWANAWLDPTGELTSAGIPSRFRAKTIADRVEAWFQREVYESFQPPHHREKMSPNRISRPAHHRELLVRHGWTIRALAPDAFEPAEVVAKREEQAAAARAAYLERQAAKSPRLRRQQRQAEWAAEREAKKVDPAAVEQARKQKMWGRIGPPTKAA